MHGMQNKFDTICTDFHGQVNSLHGKVESIDTNLLGQDKLLKTVQNEVDALNTYLQEHTENLLDGSDLHTLITNMEIFDSIQG